VAPMDDMPVNDMRCPRCAGSMEERLVGDVRVSRCSTCGGIFLDRAELGQLSEAENDWHRGSHSHTEPVPRITAGMTAPPPAKHRARSFVETLFS
jgi:Zn-finger nucleic acid-binding protein